MQQTQTQAASARRSPQLQNNSGDEQALRKNNKQQCSNSSSSGSGLNIDDDDGDDVVSNEQVSNLTSQRIVFGLNPRASRGASRQQLDAMPTVKTNAIDNNNNSDATNSKQQLVSQVAQEQQASKSQLQAKSNQKSQPQLQATSNGQLSLSDIANQNRANIEAANQSQEQQQQQQQQQQQPKRMQFFVPPPKQISTAGKTSGVSYAKSRIYDRQLKGGKLANCLVGPAESQLPAAIVSGYKPPRQVDVSKARARWESSEPFATNRSSRMLAAAKQRARERASRDASGERSPLAELSLWSTASVVDQKLQLQAAMAAAAPAAKSTSESSVKLLARGSVLERAQKFGEPTAASRLDEQQRRLSASSNSVGEFIADNSIIDAATATATATSASMSNKVKGFNQQEGVSCNAALLSSRRRSSIATLQASNKLEIPRFYTPPERCRPNTYEIERCKQSIAAAFDQLPERRASLSSATWRRCFAPLTAACGLPVYAKDALFRYVVNYLGVAIDSEGNKLNVVSVDADDDGNEEKENNATLNGKTTRKSRIALSNMRARKQSEASCCITLNNNSQQQQQAALTTSTRLRGLTRAKAASLDSPTADLTRRCAETNSSLLQANNLFISCDQFVAAWMSVLFNAQMPSNQIEAQFLHLLTFGERTFLIPNDFVNLIQSIIDEHPGLRFLRSSPDFHMRYIQTVIARIFFSCSKTWTAKLSLRELKQSNFISILKSLSKETDINNIADYFSYEQFYVIYCKFWALDKDHDLYISKDDIIKHSSELYSPLILDRIFEGCNSLPLTVQLSSELNCFNKQQQQQQLIATTTTSKTTTSKTTTNNNNNSNNINNNTIKKLAKMSYPEFVWFLIADEDKKQRRSIEYWFRCMDLDGDGYLSLFEMQLFYDEQVRRLQQMSIEALAFSDACCQLLDSIKPRDESKISLADLRRSKLTPLFFDTFVNLSKYLENEGSDFGSSTRDVFAADGRLVSDFERFCNFEYQNLIANDATTTTSTTASTSSVSTISV